MFDGLFFWIGIILLFLLATTFLIKKIFKAQTFYIGSLIKTTKHLNLLDKFVFLGKWLDRMAEIGLILGFGILAADYLYGRNKKPLQRLIPIALSIIFLGILFFLLERTFGLENPFIKQFNPLLMASFVLFGFSGFTVMSLLAYGIFIASSIPAGEKVCPGVAPLIPGVEIPNVPIVVPLHAWIALLLILIIHEGMHGIVARKEGFKIKSWGLLLAGIFPIGAFVEPDEEELRQADPIKALHVFSAGPTANFLSIIAVLILFNLLVLLLIAPLFGQWASGIQKNSIESVVVSKVDQNINVCGKIYPSPSFGKLESGMIVSKINDKNISRASILALEVSANRGKPIALTVIDKNGIQSIQNLNPTELGAFGFAVAEKPKPDYKIPIEYKIYGFAINALSGFITWLIILSLLVAMANFLPIEPFDGGKMAKILLLPYLSFLNLPKKDTEKLIGRTLAIILGILILLNALPLIL